MKEYNFYWSIKIENKEGTIYCSDEGAEEKAKELIRNTFDSSVEKFVSETLEPVGSTSVFLGMSDIKGGFSIGISLIKGEIEKGDLISMNDFVKQLTNLAMIYQEDMY